MSKKKLYYTAPDGTEVSIDAGTNWAAACGKSHQGLICTQPGSTGSGDDDPHGKWHIASAGSFIAAVWPRDPVGIAPDGTLAYSHLVHDMGHLACTATWESEGTWKLYCTEQAEGHGKWHIATDGHKVLRVWAAERAPLFKLEESKA